MGRISGTSADSLWACGRRPARKPRQRIRDPRGAFFPFSRPLPPLTPVYSWLITAGDDCYVHLIKSDSYFESPDSVVVRDISLTAQPLCLSAHMGMDMVAIGMDMDPIVQLYRISSGELVQGSLCRCTLPVRSILFSPCGRWLFVAAE